MTGFGGGNPNIKDTSPDAGYEVVEKTCPKCGVTTGHLPRHMRACTGEDQEESS